MTSISAHCCTPIGYFPLFLSSTSLVFIRLATKRRHLRHFEKFFDCTGVAFSFSFGHRHFIVLRLVFSKFVKLIVKMYGGGQKTNLFSRRENEEVPDNEPNDEDTYIVKMRGLPWSATTDDILKFLEGCNIKNGRAGVYVTMSPEGRPSGEAYVELETEEDLENACKKDKEHMGPRYIEVFRSKYSEMQWVCERSGFTLDSAMMDGVVRLRGLPFNCTDKQIRQFFEGLEIVQNGITFATDYSGRSTGEAYVQFVDKENAEKALQKHKERMGHRYIEIFRSTLTEVRSLGNQNKMRSGFGGYNNRPSPYDINDRFGGPNRFGRGGGRNFKGGYGGFDDGPWERPGWNGPGAGRGMGGPMGMKGGFGMGGGGGGWNRGPAGFSVHMRGLPFRATEQDIADFFRPVVPVDIQLLRDKSGRASGEADVEFGSLDEAMAAMKKVCFETHSSIVKVAY
ncbi:unnamed protein product [Bemisia tabaci]|uniref:RRM domain-containing protein n=1 Tax=Bemisia tabaci TaxID=7038 RepID=A0A9P0C3I0_BEMTA|nr:unnamed protein product [Bemisia tabaci]